MTQAAAPRRNRRPGRLLPQAPAGRRSAAEPACAFPAGCAPRCFPPGPAGEGASGANCTGGNWPRTLNTMGCTLSRSSRASSASPWPMCGGHRMWRDRLLPGLACQPHHGRLRHRSHRSQFYRPLGTTKHRRRGGRTRRRGQRNTPRRLDKDLEQLARRKRPCASPNPNASLSPTGLRPQPGRLRAPRRRPERTAASRLATSPQPPRRKRSLVHNPSSMDSTICEAQAAPARFLPTRRVRAAAAPWRRPISPCAQGGRTRPDSRTGRRPWPPGPAR